MSLARVQFFSVSLDGFGTGEGLSREAPFGHAGDRLHEWMFATRWWHEVVGEPGGSRGIDDALLRLHEPGIGAEIMGAGKFGYPGWLDDPEWKGWWGPNPPYHAPTFVLTHHPRASIEMEGGTTFHFVTEGIDAALKAARRAAGSQDIKIGGGVSTARQYIRAGLVDEIHLAVAPVVLGQGEALFDGLDLRALGYRTVEHVPTARATHVVLAR